MVNFNGQVPDCKSVLLDSLKQSGKEFDADATIKSLQECLLRRDAIQFTSADDFVRNITALEIEDGKKLTTIHLLGMKVVFGAVCRPEDREKLDLQLEKTYGLHAYGLTQDIYGSWKIIEKIPLDKRSIALTEFILKNYETFGNELIFEVVESIPAKQLASVIEVSKPLMSKFGCDDGAHEMLRAIWQVMKTSKNPVEAGHEFVAKVGRCMVDCNVGDHIARMMSAAALMPQSLVNEECLSSLYEISQQVDHFDILCTFLSHKKNEQKIDFINRVKAIVPLLTDEILSNNAFAALLNLVSGCMSKN